MTSAHEQMALDAVAGALDLHPGPRALGASRELVLAGKYLRPSNYQRANCGRLIAMERAAKCLLVIMALFVGAFSFAALYVFSFVIDYGLSDSPF